MNSITRETAVAQIRRALIAMQEEGQSICRIVAEKGILCRGFSRDTDEELRWRYAAAEERFSAATSSTGFTKPAAHGTTFPTMNWPASATSYSANRCA
jgi:hypothetical protein